MKKIIYLIVIGLLCVGCCSSKEVIREVPVNVVHDVYHKVYIHDTINTVDSTIIYQKGDTVFKEKYRDRYKEKLIYDTLVTHDTIPEPYPVIKEKIVKDPQWWPVYLFSGIITLIIGVYLAIKYKLFHKLHI